MQRVSSLITNLLCLPKRPTQAPLYVRDGLGALLHADLQAAGFEDARAVREIRRGEPPGGVRLYDRDRPERCQERVRGVQKGANHWSWSNLSPMFSGPRGFAKSEIRTWQIRRSSRISLS